MTVGTVEVVSVESRPLIEVKEDALVGKDAVGMIREEEPFMLTTDINEESDETGDSTDVTLPPLVTNAVRV